MVTIRPTDRGDAPAEPTARTSQELLERSEVVPARNDDREWVREQIVRAVFWGAILLPLLYLPLLLGGIQTTGELFVFLGLLAVHVAALLVGHRHRIPSRPAPSASMEEGPSRNRITLGLRRDQDRR